MSEESQRDSLAAQILRLQRMVRVVIWIAVISGIVSASLGIAALVQAKAAISRINNLDQQVGEEFASLATNPAAYFRQAQDFDRALEKMKTDMSKRREKTAQ